MEKVSQSQFAQVSEEDLKQFSSITNVQLRIPVAKHNFQAGCFDFPKDPQLDSNPNPNKEIGRRESIVAALIHVEGNIRRYYEDAYDPNRREFKPPTCASLDGKSGTRVSELRTLPSGNDTKVFGSCEECFFSQFRSKQVFDPKVTSIAPACSSYALAFVLMDFTADGDGGIPIVIQIPPTGVKVIAEIQQVALQRHMPLPDVALWEFMGSGGKVGQSRTAMSVSFKSPLTQQGWARLRDIKKEFQPIIQKYMTAFEAGMDLNDVGNAKQDAADSDRVSNSDIPI